MSFFNNITKSVLFRNIGGTFIIKGFSIIVQLLSVPAYISYFENDGVLGIWYTLIAALNWILVFDFGVGNGLRNNLSKALSLDDYDEGKKLVSTAYIVMGFLALVLIVIGELLILNSDFETLLNYHSGDLKQGTLKITVSIVYIGIVIQFWLKLLTSVLYSMQKTALNNCLFLLGNVILLLWVLFFRFDDVNERLIAMALIQIMGINLPLLICTLILFLGRYHSISPSLSYFNIGAIHQVLGLGVEFFAIQIALLVVNSTNEYLITYLYNSANVLTYQVYYKWFFAIITVFSLIIQPMWSAMTVAWHEHRYVWVANAYKRFNLIALVGSIGAFTLAAVFPWLVDIWIGKGGVTASFEVGCVFAFWVVITIFVNSATCLSNATSRLKVQLLLTIFAAVLKVPMSMFFQSIGLGWESVMLANGLVLVPLLIGQIIANKTMLTGVLN